MKYGIIIQSCVFSFVINYLKLYVELYPGKGQGESGTYPGTTGHDTLKSIYCIIIYII